MKTNFSTSGSGIFAGRIKKPRKYSDVTITNAAGEKRVVAAGRPVKHNEWEPNEVVKK